jgi:hypothetical protein
VEDSNSEIFTVRARRCKRCGGLLTSKQAVADGYGHVCKMKTADEKYARQPIDGQLSLLEFAENEQE